MTPAEHIHAIAAAQGMTMSDLARRLGVPRTTLDAWLRRAVPSSWAALARLLPLADDGGAALLGALRGDIHGEHEGGLNDGDD